MGVTSDILVYNSGSPTESSNVGAYLRDSAGNLIPSQTVATSKWLQVASALFDGSGNALASTSGALNVYFSGGALDVGTADGSTFTVGTSVEQPTGGLYATSYTALATGKTGAFAMTAYRALSVALQTAGGVFLLGSSVSASSIPVVIASDQGAVSVTPTVDLALANTASKASLVSVTSTAAALIASALTSRKYMNIQNNGTVSIFVGDSAVTATTGTRIPPGSIAEFRVGATNSLYAIVSSTTNANVNILELS